jgi:hypothetical protein
MAHFERWVSFGLLAAAVGCVDFESGLDRGPATQGMMGATDGSPAMNQPRTDPRRAPSPPAGTTGPDAAPPSSAASTGSVYADAGIDGSVPMPGTPAQPDGGARRECLDGVVAMNSCYLASTDLLSWADARLFCLAWGGDLVQIENAQEDSLVGSMGDDNIWLGASDIVVDGTFVWADGSAIVFSNWGNNQPDAFPGPDCAEKRQEAGEPWYDQPCTDTKSYVCERALDPDAG